MAVSATSSLHRYQRHIVFRNPHLKVFFFNTFALPPFAVDAVPAVPFVALFPDVFQCERMAGRFR